MRSIRQFASAEQVSHAAAEEFLRMARDASGNARRFTVALAGGSTPKHLYTLLASAPFSAQVNWSNVEFFWGDERPVPPDHKDSNFGMAFQAMLAPLQIPDAHIHRMLAESPDQDAAAHTYQIEIARVLGVPNDGPAPSFDLVLLGMGADGHTASLFPHTAALQEGNRWVVSNNVPKLSAHRMTLTASTINQAKCVIFLVAGADKAAVLAEVLEGPIDAQRLPSQLIQVPAGRLLWCVDRAAASQLRQRPDDVEVG